MDEKWICFTAGGGLPDPAMDSWIPSGWTRVSEWEPISAVSEYVGPAGFSMVEAVPVNWQTMILWRARVAKDGGA